jgi:N-acetylmuramoyl-L-alanine amidase
MKRIILLFAGILFLCMQANPALAGQNKESKIVSLDCREIVANDSHPSGMAVEFGFSGEIRYEGSLAADSMGLVLTVENSSVKKIKDSVEFTGRLIEKIQMERVKNSSVIRIATRDALSSDRYRIYEREADLEKKRPAALVVEIYDESLHYYAPSLKSRTIVLDAGHGGSDPGAIGAGGTREKDVTLEVTQKLKRMLSAAGANVVLTREDDRDVYAPNATGAQELGARVNVAEKNRAAVLISIHANSFSNPEASGTGTYYYAESRASARLAKCLQSGMMDKVATRDRGTPTANFYVLKRSSMPAALVELAFISNYGEERLLASESGQQKLAEGLYEGIVRYFE